MHTHIQKEERLFVHSIGEVFNHMETLGYGWRADLTPNAITEVKYAESPRQD